MKTILAIPYVLNDGPPGLTEVEALGVHHAIRISTDQIAQRPQIDHETTTIVRNEGTVVRVHLDSACSQADGAEPGFLQRLIDDYSLFNPHATFEVSGQEGDHVVIATTPSWKKWLPTHPTPAHWYNVERLESLIGCCISGERSGGKIRTLREFVSEFRGLSGSAKQQQVLKQADLTRSHLRDLTTNGKFDRDAVSRLLAAMKEFSAAVKPEMLGVLGREHFEQRLQPEGRTFRYTRNSAIDESGLPYILETAFAVTKPGGLRGFRVGLNWSVPLGNPFHHGDFRIDGEHLASGLPALLENQRINFGRDPVCLAVHIACPRFQYLDRGKGSLALGGNDGSESLRNQVSNAVLTVTKDWAAIKRKEERDRRQANRAREQYTRGRACQITAKEAAYQVMRDAYWKASGQGQYPANARQIMYAARPAIQDRTGEVLNDVYFTQVLLPDYMRDHPAETEGWDVVFDARGHLREPHTDVEIGLGTLEVRDYLRKMGESADTAIPTPRISDSYPTSGAANRFAAVLYIEKEGFQPLLERAAFAERYDLAIMSSKGMSTTAARTLIERLSREATVFVLHDFDKAGFSILGTLTRDTRRYAYCAKPNVVDLGLRLSDVTEWNLQSEQVSYGRSDPKWNLKDNGAGPEEIEFLRTRRVELNAFTSEQFVEWLTQKLTRHGVRKVVPDDPVLVEAYRRAYAIARYQMLIDDARAELAAYANDLNVPHDLQERIRRRLVEDPRLSWDDAVLSLARRRAAES